MPKFLAALLILLLSGAAAAQESLTVYSFRQESLVQPLLDRFTERTGIKTRVLYAREGLIERLQAEGSASPASLVLTSDLPNLEKARRLGLTQAVKSDELEALIPEHFRDSEGHWFGLTARARIIYASKERVQEGTVGSYKDLVDPEWKGKVCIRDGKHPYNLGLFAALYARWGEAEFTSWLKGLRDNLARRPQGNDRAQVKAIWAGECDLSLGNSYYFGKMLASEEQRAWAGSVRLIFPDQAAEGTHMNISGAFIPFHAPQPENARSLLLFLASKEAQKLYAEANFEFAVHAEVKSAELVKGWGDFKADHIPVELFFQHQLEVLDIVDEIGFNF